MGNVVKVEHRVQGRCPSCGLETLFLEYDGGINRPGRVRCSLIGCRAPDMANTLLERTELIAMVAHGKYGDASVKAKKALGI
jgi:hypothetical protein